MKSIKKAVLRWRSNKKNSDIKRSRHATLKQQQQPTKEQSDDQLLTSCDESCSRPEECRISSFLNSSSSIAIDFSKEEWDAIFAPALKVFGKDAASTMGAWAGVTAKSSDRLLLREESDLSRVLAVAGFIVEW